MKHEDSDEQDEQPSPKKGNVMSASKVRSSSFVFESRNVLQAQMMRQGHRRRVTRHLIPLTIVPKVYSPS